jgi:hypothetical protein
MRKEIDLEGLATRLIASLVLVAFGVFMGAIRPGLLGLPGKVVALAGLFGLVHSGRQIYQWWVNRPDPYDLAKLWEETPPEPEEPSREAESDALVLCHRCGSSMPPHIGVCPECGSRLGY